MHKKRTRSILRAPNTDQVREGHWVDHQPVSGVADGGVITFLSTGTEDYVDLATILDKTLKTIPSNITKLLNIDKTNFVSPSPPGPPVQCCEQRRNNFW